MSKDLVVEKIKFNNNFCLVTLSNSEKFKLPFKIVDRFNISFGSSINDELYDKLIYENNHLMVKESAYRYLSLREHSKFELKMKLRKKGFDNNSIDYCIQELVNNKYLDDEHYAKNLVDNLFHLKKQGRNKIISKLIEKGISRVIIDKVVENRVSDDESVANARDVAIKKFNYLNKISKDEVKNKSKLFRFLLSKGYQGSIASQIVKSINSDKEFIIS